MARNTSTAVRGARSAPGFRQRVRELEAAINAELEAIAPGAFWTFYERTERGGRKVNGPHVNVCLPRNWWDDRMAFKTRGLASKWLQHVFNTYYGNVVRVGRTTFVQYASKDNKDYAVVRLDLAPVKGR